MEQLRLVAVGKVSRVHGVRGFVRIYPYGESLAEQQTGDRLQLASSARNGEQETLTIASLQPHGPKLLLVQFTEIETREKAEKLLGKEIFLPPERLSPTTEGEYYHYQLLGLAVETTKGVALGKIASIIETGSNDVYVIAGQGKEVLIPALEDIVISIDLTNGQMIVDPPEGLIDDL